jgi:hypothetical protein
MKQKSNQNVKLHQMHAFEYWKLCTTRKHFPVLLLLQFQHAVQLSMEDSDAVKNKQEYTLLAIISHKGDTPNSGMSLHNFIIYLLCDPCNQCTTN